MKPATSLYLDAARAVAAFGVFLTHGRFEFFSSEQDWLPDCGHEMVVVFFVLSGFVIAFSHRKRPDDWRSFASDRLSRIYSVAIPAIVLTATLDHIGMWLAPKLYADQLPQGNYWLRMLLAGSFLNQSWSLSSKAGSNWPFWSLSYEVWYYVMFGCWMFIHPFGLRLVLITCCVLLTGLKIVLLLPIWLLGVAAFHVTRHRRFSAPAAGLVAAASGGLLGLVFTGRFSFPGTPENWSAVSPLFFSGRAWIDLQIGIVVAIHIVAVDALCQGIGTPLSDGWAFRCIRFCANRSFSLYLFHLPLLLFLSAVIPYDGKSSLQVIGVMVLALLLVGIISEFSEQRREPWRRFFRNILGAQPVVGSREIAVSSDRVA